MRIFLKTHTKRLMFHYQLFYSVQLAFLVIGSIFDGGVFQKILIFCYFQKMVFLQKIWTRLPQGQFCGHKHIWYKLLADLDNY